MTKLFSKLEKYELIASSIKIATAIAGSSTILAEAKPWISLTVLAIGGIANEFVMRLQKKLNSPKSTNENNAEPA